MAPVTTAAELLALLEGQASVEGAAATRRRVPEPVPVLGVRMGTLFDIAKRASTLPPAEIDLLAAEDCYEARLAAFCLLDFRARRTPGEPWLLESYLRHHDRIITWDMVDRAAPWVVGATVSSGPYDVLHDLARSADPLRRRTAITAPLWFVRRGTDADLAEGFTVAAGLCDDPEPVVTNAVGIYLGHAGDRDPGALDALLAAHEPSMPRRSYRLAIRKRRAG
ncbi:DNA alkylation repair protein [Nocardioides sp. SOB44]|uniref:DNA alkylation repair protein n=1 Tax=Nocardioides cremeus TaxID=3058044 RepID=A0ABT8TRE9_9ACTN|nr:DNA alkylation repair protein [Nocardioides cremeus]MDO3395568.1 DNA alkylation repair protein [Nocardioides cremeus]